MLAINAMSFATCTTCNDLHTPYDMPLLPFRLERTVKTRKSTMKALQTRLNALKGLSPPHSEASDQDIKEQMADGMMAVNQGEEPNEGRSDDDRPCGCIVT